MNVVLQVFRYTCGKCAHKFRDLALPSEQYGLLLMRSKGNQIAILPALEAKEYDEVSDMLAVHPNLHGISDFTRSDILQDVFGELCDPSSDGSTFSITRNTTCPQCGSTTMAAWGAVDPAEWVDRDLPVVCNSRWQSMNSDLKNRTLDDALRNHGYIDQD